MARETQVDFKVLEQYIRTYSFDKLLNDNDFRIYMRGLHKRYYSLLVWNAEFVKNQQQFKVLYNTGINATIAHLSESVSDIGSAFLSWINGDYKASRIMQRSAIENSIRGVGSIERTDFPNIDSVYSLFDNSKRMYTFTERETTKRVFKRLRSNYKELCKDTHSSSVEHMALLSSLSHFPRFEATPSDDCRKIFYTVVTGITSLYCLTFNRFFHSMHYKNKAIILDSLAKPIRASINNI